MKYQKEQNLLAEVVPQWHYRIARPFKQFCENGITPEAYHCLLTLLWQGDGLTMSELARLAGMSPQQTTRVVNRLIQGGFARRENDPVDRRVIRLRTTEYAREYVQRFRCQQADYYEHMFEDMGEDGRDAFCAALETLRHVFGRLPNACCRGEEEREIGERKDVSQC